MQRWISWGVMLLVVVVLVIVAFGITCKVEGQYVMPLVAVISVLTMFAVIAFVAAVYKHFGISNVKQALALPEGSVRALIALSLIIIFAVIALYMLPRLSATPDVVSEIVKLVSAEKPGSTPAGSADGKGSMQSTASQAIAAMQARQNAATDLAKQLLTMLGTLLTSIASFYFGASATASGANVGQQPTVQGGSKTTPEGGGNAQAAGVGNPQPAATPAREWTA